MVDLKNVLKNLLKKIEKYEELNDGIEMNSPILRIENKIEKYLDKLNTSNVEEINKFVFDSNIVLDDYLEKVIIYNKNKKEFIQKIIEKTNNTCGFIKFHNPDDESVFLEVSKLPFFIWCLSNPYKSLSYEDGCVLDKHRNHFIELWGEILSSSGEKLPNDDEYHNEWIRSMNIEPEVFYDFIDNDENKWFKDLILWYAEDLKEFLILKQNETISNFIDVVNYKNLNKLKTNDDFLNIDFTLPTFFKKNNVAENTILKSIPYNININSSFPIYFKPMYEKNKSLEEIIKNKIVVVENSDESINEIAINLSDFDNSIIFTNNSSKTAHLINISKDINLNIFYLSKDIILDEKSIYKIEKNGDINLLIDNSDFNVENEELILSNCDENNIYNISDKVKNLAKLYNNNFNNFVIPNGFFKFGEELPNFNKNFNFENIIARSAGTNEGNTKLASFSGLFSSKLLTNNNVDNFEIVQSIIDSFKKPHILKYCSKMKVDIPKVGIFYQEYINADESFVIKCNDKEIYIESFNGSADNIVNGIKETKKYLFYKNDDVGELKDLIKIVFDIFDFLNKDNLEMEIVKKDNVFYIVQVI